jgi:hypothetical protein
LEASSQLQKNVIVVVGWFLNVFVVQGALELVCLNKPNQSGAKKRGGSASFSQAFGESIPRI